MNRSAKTVISTFLSQENGQHIYAQLIALCGGPKSVSYISKHIAHDMHEYVARIEAERGISEIDPNWTVRDVVEYHNTRFIDDRIQFMNDYIEDTSSIPIYGVTDGLPVSHSRARTSAGSSSDDVLRSWLSRPVRLNTMRDDPAELPAPTSTYVGPTTKPGVVYCDQSKIGQQRHIDMYENTSYKIALNRPSGHEDILFGVSTPVSDARLLGRRTFRNNERGVENGLPRYEARLYNRHYDRDIDEALSGTERGCMVHGHDMSSLHRRVDHKNKVRELQPQTPRTRATPHTWPTNPLSGRLVSQPRCMNSLWADTRY